jgi:hypothetical protein
MDDPVLGLVAGNVLLHDHARLPAVARWNDRKEFSGGMHHRSVRHRRRAPPRPGFGVLYDYRECGSGGELGELLVRCRAYRDRCRDVVPTAQFIEPLLAGECSRQPRFDAREEEVLRQLIGVLCNKHRCLLVNRHDDGSPT